MAGTILDGLMHRCTMLEFEGKSYRLTEAGACARSPPSPRYQFGPGARTKKGSSLARARLVAAWVASQLRMADTVQIAAERGRNLAFPALGRVNAELQTGAARAHRAHAVKAAHAAPERLGG